MNGMFLSQTIDIAHEGDIRRLMGTTVKRLPVARYKMSLIHQLWQSTQRGPRQRVNAEPLPIPFALRVTT